MAEHGEQSPDAVTEAMTSLMDEPNGEGASGYQDAVAGLLGNGDLEMYGEDNSFLFSPAENDRVSQKNKCVKTATVVGTDWVIVEVAENIFHIGAGAAMGKIDFTNIKLAQIKKMLENLDQKVNIPLDTPLKMAQEHLSSAVNMLSTENIAEAVSELQKVSDESLRAFHHAEAHPDKDSKKLEEATKAVKMVIFSIILVRSYDKNTETVKPFLSLPKQKQELIALELRNYVDKILVMGANTKTGRIFSLSKNKKKFEIQEIQDSLLKVAYPYISEGSGWNRSSDILEEDRCSLTVLPKYLGVGEEDKTAVVIGRVAGKYLQLILAKKWFPEIPVLNENQVSIKLWRDDNNVYVNGVAFGLKNLNQEMKIDIPFQSVPGPQVWKQYKEAVSNLHTSMLSPDLVSLDPNASQRATNNINIDSLSQKWKYIIRSLYPKDAEEIIHSIEEVFGIEDISHKIITTFLLLKKSQISGELNVSQLKDKLYTILEKVKKILHQQLFQIQSACSNTFSEYPTDDVILTNHSTLIKKLLPNYAIPIIEALYKLYDTDENKAIATEHILNRYCTMQFTSLDVIEEARDSILQYESSSKHNFVFVSSYTPVYGVIIYKSRIESLKYREVYREELTTALNSIKTNGWLSVSFGNKVHTSSKFLCFDTEGLNQNKPINVENKNINIAIMSENEAEDLDTIDLDLFRDIWGKPISNDSHRRQRLGKIKETFPHISYNTAEDILEHFNNNIYIYPVAKNYGDIAGLTLMDILDYFRRHCRTVGDTFIDETYRKWKSNFETNFFAVITPRKPFENVLILKDYGLSKIPKMKISEINQKLEIGEIHNGDQIWFWRRGSLTDSYAHVVVFVDEETVATSKLVRNSCKLVRDLVHANDEVYEGNGLFGEEIARRAIACYSPKSTFYYNGCYASCETFATKICSNSEKEEKRGAKKGEHAEKRAQETGKKGKEAEKKEQNLKCLKEAAKKEVEKEEAKRELDKKRAKEKEEAEVREQNEKMAKEASKKEAGKEKFRMAEERETGWSKQVFQYLKENIESFSIFFEKWGRNSDTKTGIKKQEEAVDTTTGEKAVTGFTCQTSNIAGPGVGVILFWLVLSVLSNTTVHCQTLHPEVQDFNFNLTPRISEFQLSETNDKKVTVSLPSMASNNNCQLGLIIEVKPALLQSGVTSVKGTGQIRFTAEHPNFQNKQETFTVIVDDEKFGRKRLLKKLCFTKCENINPKTLLLNAITDIREVKNITIESAEGNTACKEKNKTNDPWETVTLVSIIIACIFSILTVLIIIKAGGKVKSLELPTEFEKVGPHDENQEVVTVKLM